MKSKVRIIWSDQAKYSLRSIFEYIKNRESITMARRVRDKIVAKVKNLPIFPEKFSEEDYAMERVRNIRSTHIWSYKIIYEVEGEKLIVLDIFHASRNPTQIEQIVRQDDEEGS